MANSQRGRHTRGRGHHEGKKSKAVKQYSAEGVYLKTYAKTIQAAEALFPNLDYQNSADLEVLRSRAGHISACAHGRKKKAHGYIWLKDEAVVPSDLGAVQCESCGKWRSCVQQWEETAPFTCADCSEREGAWAEEE